MQKWLAFLETKTADNVLEFYKSHGINMAQWNFLGDWVTPRRSGKQGISRDPQSARFINNLHHLYTLQLAARIAAILGEKDDAASYEAKAAALSRALRRPGPFVGDSAQESTLSLPERGIVEFDFSRAGEINPPAMLVGDMCANSAF